jgi:integrase
VPIRPATKDTKPRAGKRPIGLPPQIVSMLETHRREQDKQRTGARQLWHTAEWVFTD